MTERRPRLSCRVRAQAIAVCICALGLLAVGEMGGCQSGRTFILAPAQTTSKTSDRFQSVRLVEGTSTAKISPEFKRYFVDALRKELSQDVVLVSSLTGQDDLVITYRFVHYDPGEVPVRIGAALVGLVGVPTGSLGMGDLAIDVVYSNSGGEQLAHVVVNGPIDGPVASTDTGLDTAASCISDYTHKHFLVPVNAAPQQEETVRAETRG